MTRARAIVAAALVVSVSLPACTTPDDRACAFARSVPLGATQYEVQQKLGKPWRWSEEPEGTLWRYRFPKPGWLIFAEVPLLMTVVLFPLIFVLEGHWSKAFVHVWFDERGRVEEAVAVNPSERRSIECAEGEEPRKVRPFTR